MNSDVLAAPRPFPRLAQTRLLRSFLQHGAIVAVLAATLVAAAYVWTAPPYSADDDIGYNLGLVGGVLMLMLLPYSLRKRLRSLRGTGSMRMWFLFHIAAGILGPVLVLFHSTFRIGSFNGGVALFSTLLVAASGAVGRFFYRRVHRGLSGSRATLQEMQATLRARSEALQPLLCHLPEVAREIAHFSELAAREPRGHGGRLTHFIAIGWHRMRTTRRIRTALRHTLPETHADEAASLLRTVDDTLTAAQRAARFATYERLFSLWHAVHIPFLYLLVLTSVVHVVAVHAY